MVAEGLAAHGPLDQKRRWSLHETGIAPRTVVSLAGLRKALEQRLATVGVPDAIGALGVVARVVAGGQAHVPIPGCVEHQADGKLGALDVG